MPTGKACSPAIPAQSAPGSPAPSDDRGSAVMSKNLWPINKNQAVVLRCFFIEGTPNQKKAVENTVKTWMDFANVMFQYVGDAKDSDIRISFVKGKGSWSVIGARTDQYEGVATMNLGWLQDVETPSREDRATILHEFGHALGMMHEHQSPARGGRIHLRELEVYRYYRPLLQNNDALVKSQVIDTYNSDLISNYSQMDLESIMMYFMPARLNEEGIDIPVNLELSEMDKSFITLNYPGNKNGKMPIDEALKIAGVTGETAKQITTDIQNGDYPGARDKFIDYNRRVMNLSSINKSLVNSVDVVAGHGILAEASSTMFTNPLFKAILKNIIHRALTQSSEEPPALMPGSSPRNVLDSIGALVTNPQFADEVSKIGKELAPYAMRSQKENGNNAVINTPMNVNVLSVSPGLKPYHMDVRTELDETISIYDNSIPGAEEISGAPNPDTICLFRPSVEAAKEQKQEQEVAFSNVPDYPPIDLFRPLIEASKKENIGTSAPGSNENTVADSSVDLNKLMEGRKEQKAKRTE